MERLPTEHLRILFRWFKDGPPGAIPIEHDHRSLGRLQAVTWEDAGCAADLERLAAWHSLPSVAARAWLADQVLPAADRVLFWVKDIRGEAIGHVGLCDLDDENGTIAICDVLCDDPAAERLLAAALASLGAWVRHSLHLSMRQEAIRRAA